MPACLTSWHLYFLHRIKSYSSLSVEVAGISTAAGATSSITASLPSSTFESFWANPLLKETFERRIRAARRIANVQVVLSKKSFVFLTPPTTCVLPPKLEDSPPPFGF